MIQKGTSSPLCGCSTKAVNGKKLMTLALVKFYIKENLHLDKLQVENSLVVSLHLSAVNLDQLSVVFLLGNLVPFPFPVLVLGLQPFSGHCCSVVGTLAFLCV